MALPGIGREAPAASLGGRDPLRRLQRGMGVTNMQEAQIKYQKKDSCFVFFFWAGLVQLSEALDLEVMEWKSIFQDM